MADAKKEAASKIAAEWLKLIDNADYGKAWDECSALFREKVTRQQWVDGIPKNRAEFGKFNTRKLFGAVYRKTMPGAPDGDYVTVRFLSDFEKNPAAEESVTLTYQGGAWRPLRAGRHKRQPPVVQPAAGSVDSPSSRGHKGSPINTWWSPPVSQSALEMRQPRRGRSPRPASWRSGLPE